MHTETPEYGREVLTLYDEVHELVREEILLTNVNVEVLDLSCRGMSVLPSEIGRLTNLKRLVLLNNSIRVLPEELWQLTKLEVLKLNSNQLSIFPNGVSQLKNLKKLALLNNPGMLIDASANKVMQELYHCKIKIDHKHVTPKNA